MRRYAGFCPSTTPVELWVRLGPSRSSPLRARRNLLRQKQFGYDPGAELPRDGAPSQQGCLFGFRAHRGVDLRVTLDKTKALLFHGPVVVRPAAPP